MNSKYYFLLILLLTSCGSINSVKKQLCKRWIIEKVEYEKEEYPLTIFTSNVIKFESNGNCKVPKVEGYILNNASWSILKEDSEFYIEIYDAKYPGFNNTYLLNTQESELGSKRIQLKSKGYTFYCITLE